MASPAVLAELPSASLFRFPPNANPAFIPPPPVGSIAFAPPFAIPDHIYQAALDARVPLTIATVYAVTAKALNIYNRSTNRRPWAISKTRPFFVFVVLHNVFLAVYSAWTWYGMLGALRRSFVNPFASGVDSSTGSFNTGGWAATVDSMCRLGGAPGLGNGLTFNENLDQWQVSSAMDNTIVIPDRTQPGRLWNEGLLFYGWIFYLSKFYEVLDTFIILAKGKYSSTLQTYHHAGAMMCMWAGMRFISAPIWIFVFFNSAIHAMMYTYFTITAFSIRVPTFIKRTLTTMQIMQFVFGASFAMVHSFISYSVPVVLSSVSKSAEASDKPQTILSTVKGLFSSGSASAPSAKQTLEAVNTTYSDGTNTITYGLKTVPCITTTSETFAIWLNVLYLAPLTYLFVSFFIASYMRRSSAESARTARLGKTESSAPAPAPTHPNTTIANTLATATAAEERMIRRLSNVGQMAEKAGWDAARDLEKEVYGESAEAVEEEEEEEETEHLTVQPRQRRTRSSVKH